MKKPYATGIFAALLLTLLLPIFLRGRPDPARAPSDRNEIEPSQPESRARPAPEFVPTSPDERGETVADTSPASDTRTVTVRDLANGDPVPDLGLRFATGGFSTSTDASGIALIPAEAREALVANGTRWQVAQQRGTPSESTPPDTLWVYRTILVRGTVVVERLTIDFEPDDVTLSWIVKAGTFELDPGAPDELAHRMIAARKSPWSDVSLGRHGFRDQRIRARVDSQGRFETRVPAIRGIVITASHEGYAPAQAEVPVSTDFEEADIELPLEPALRIRGTLRTTAGEPVKNCRFRIYSVLIQPPGVVDQGAIRARKPRGGLTVTADAERTVVKYGYSAGTDEKGKFQAFIGVRGQLVAVADFPGHGPLRRELGFASRDIDDLDLVLPGRSAQARIKILHKGAPLRSATLLLGDLNPLDGYAQHASRVLLDEDGVLSSDSLLRGRKYYLGVADPKLPTEPGSGCFVWEGQETIDIADLRPASELKG